jgi:hypothetical protein
MRIAHGARRGRRQEAARNVRRPLDQSDPLSLAAEATASPAPRQIQFNDRTKTEQTATILLPNPVAAHDTERSLVDGRAKIFKENNTA